MDIEKIVDYLNPIKDQLETMFNWKPKNESLTRIVGKLPESLINSKSIYKSYIELKWQNIQQRNYLRF